MSDDEKLRALYERARNEPDLEKVKSLYNEALVLECKLAAGKPLRAPETRKMTVKRWNKQVKKGRW